MSIPLPEPKVFVGLTTTPPRLGFVADTIKSLLNQTKKPDQIVLAVPHTLARTGQAFGDIPKELSDLDVVIKRVDDRGPGTKIVAAFDQARSDEDFLIWCDDDIIYPENLVSVLVQTCIPKCAVAVSGFFMLGGLYCPITDHFGYAEFLEGYGGVCCRKRNMPDVRTLFPVKTNQEYNAMPVLDKARFVADDFVISNAFRKMSVPTLVCHRQDLNRSHILSMVREIGLGGDALHQNKEFGGNLGSYSFLKLHES